MRRVTQADYTHLEFCDGADLVADFGEDNAQSYPIGDFFWNEEETEDGRFSIRLHADDLAFRAPLRRRYEIAEARIWQFANVARQWAVVCRCGTRTLTTYGVMRFDAPDSLWPSVVYAHFAPGLMTDDPRSGWR